MMGAHEATRARTDEWYTPAWIFDGLAVRFDLDPASAGFGVDAVPARRKFTREDDGFSQEWSGLVWLNPPYGRYGKMSAWLDRFTAHGCGVCLVPNRTETLWWQKLAGACRVVLFLSGRVKHLNPGRTERNQPGFGSCLFGIGDGADIVERANLAGILYRDPIG